ncbi:MAG: class I SAM-dependent methyltransferase [Bacillota bacterium]|nr:class I SAM-dependent methyltransferase [Bacillota bacterium]
MGLNTLFLAHKFVSEHVRPGDLCIDATAGKGRDTAFLCSLTGENGKVLSFDIQPAAVEQTKALLSEKGFDSIADVFLDSHENMEQYAAAESVSCIMFNFGWLPGGDHKLFTRPESSIPAIEAGLRLLKPGGIMSLCIYYGGESGYEERDALLAYLAGIDNRKYTVIVNTFHNRTGDPPIPVFLYKEI